MRTDLFASCCRLHSTSWKRIIGHLLTAENVLSISFSDVRQHTKQAMPGARQIRYVIRGRIFESACPLQARILKCAATLYHKRLAGFTRRVAIPVIAKKHKYLHTATECLRHPYWALQRKEQLLFKVVARFGASSGHHAHDYRASRPGNVARTPASRPQPSTLSNPYRKLDLAKTDS